MAQAAQALEAIFYQGDEQGRLDFTPGGDTLNGVIVDMGTIIGIVTTTGGILSGVLGSLATKGVFKVKKAVGTGVVFAQTAAVFWDTVGRTAVAAAGAGIIAIGYASEASVTGDNHVKTRINEAFTQ